MFFFQLHPGSKTRLHLWYCMSGDLSSRFRGWSVTDCVSCVLVSCPFRICLSFACMFFTVLERSFEFARPPPRRLQAPTEAVRCFCEIRPEAEESEVGWWRPGRGETPLRTSGTGTAGSRRPPIHISEQRAARAGDVAESIAPSSRRRVEHAASLVSSGPSGSHASGSPQALKGSCTR